MRIDDGAKREVLARIDIGEYIGAFVSLRKRGNDLVGLCPFHGEKTPSFHVHPDRGFFKCFGCGAGGDVIRFVQLHENVGFVEALRMLAKRAGIELESEDPRAARVRSEKEAIYHANEVAARWFHRILLADPAGAPGRAYCEGRGLDRATVEAFMLGYAPDGWEGLVEELRREGVDPAIAVKAGLAKEGQRGYYDFYRGRLMVPTRALTGETIAFGGRLVGEGEPKYLNTATTPVYTKGRFLFALGTARRAAQREGAIIVVEGYLDCIALHQGGFTHAVASLGTAFSPEQAHELRKVTERVFVCFDGDAAGRAAAAKSVDVLIAEGLAVRVVHLPDEEDPDSFVRTTGRAAFRSLLDQAVPWIQFKIDRELEGLEAGGFGSPAELARRAEALVRGLPREEWDRWRVYVAGRLSLNVDDLRKSRLLTSSTYFAPRNGVSRGGRHVAPALLELPSFERDVLAVTLEEPRLLAEYAERIGPERFADPALRRIYQALHERAEELSQPADLFALFSEEGDVSTLASIAGAERSRTVRFADSDARREYLDRLVERFAADDRRRRFRELDARVDALLEAGESVPLELREEHSALYARLKG